MRANRLARILLRPSAMLLRFLVLASLIGRARADQLLSVTSDLSIGRDFTYWRSDTHVGAGALPIAAEVGLTLISDYKVSRAGLQSVFDFVGTAGSGGLAAAYAPTQAGRGWASLEPHAAFSLERDWGALAGSFACAFRTAGVELARTDFPVGQVQLTAELQSLLFDKWQVDLEGWLSFYDPDLSSRRLRSANTGLLVTLAGRPERWALRARFTARVHDKVALEGGGAAVEYADGRGGAAAPELALDLGPFHGISLKPRVELAIGIAGAARDPLHPIAGLSVEYEHQIVSKKRGAR